MDLEYARRLNEMITSQTARRLQQQQQQEHFQQLEQQRRRLDLDSIPILQLPGRQEKQRKEEQQQQTDPAKPAVDWRQVVEHVRRTGATVTGQQMLTDTFR